MSAADAQGRPIRKGKYPELAWQGIIVGDILGSVIAISMSHARLMARALRVVVEGSHG